MSRYGLSCKIVFVILAFVVVSEAQGVTPLKLVDTIPMSSLHDGDFDHFAKDVEGHRIFVAAEANGSVQVFDTTSNKLVHNITGMESPHALLYRRDVNKLFVVDGDASRITVYDGTSFQLLESVPVAVDADSMAYDSDSKYMYVVNGGRAAKTPFSLISVIDTSTSKKLRDIKISTNWVEALLLEKSGPRMFCVLTSLNAIGVMDRNRDSLTATWPLPSNAKHPVSLGFDESNRRLFVATRDPGQLVVLNSDNGQVVAQLNSVGMVDDLAFDPKLKRIYMAGDGAIDVYSEKGPDHYSLLAKIPGSFRAKTGLLVTEWNRYYLAVPGHKPKNAEVRVYEVEP